MMNKKILAGLAVVLVSVMTISCNKDNGNPTIKFVTGPAFSGRDTMVRVDYTITVTLQVDWNGIDNLKQLDVKQNDVLLQSFPLSGETATLNLNIRKGADQLEKWTFVIIDQKDNQSEITLKITKDPSSEYGAILYYSPVGLGSHMNTSRGGFIGFQNKQATTYSLEGAFINQSKIDLLYYSDTLTHATFASPGSDIPDNLYPGSRNIILWTVRNVSVFEKSAMTVQDFNSITNDAPIVTAWSDAQAVSRATELKVNDVWLVKLQSGKKGAILVKNIVSGDAGEIEFAIKIQE
jgi:hypothetical protein